MQNSEGQPPSGSALPAQAQDVAHDGLEAERYPCALPDHPALARQTSPTRSRSTAILVCSYHDAVTRSPAGLRPLREALHRHLVVENGKTPKMAGGATVAVDLGEIHPAAATDGQSAIVVSCRELRAKRQYTAKRMAYLQSRQSDYRKKSRRWWKLQKVKNRFRAKQQRRLRDMEHKISRTVVNYAGEARAGTLAIGDVRDIGDAPGKGAHHNQKLSTWRHGKLRAYLTYKAEAEGMAVVVVNERHTSQTCPNPICNQRHKPAGRVYRCPACGFQAHRDVVGAVNILSRQITGDVGKIRPPPTAMYRHPARPGKRSGPDTGQPAMAVACDKQEAAGL